MDELLTLKKITVDQLADILKNNGFHYIKAFSTYDHRIYVSTDGSLKVLIHKDEGKVYSSKDNKNCLNSFTIVMPLPKLTDVKRKE